MIEILLSTTIFWVLNLWLRQSSKCWKISMLICCPINLLSFSKSAMRIGATWKSSELSKYKIKWMKLTKSLFRPMHNCATKSFKIKFETALIWIPLWQYNHRGLSQMLPRSQVAESEALQLILELTGIKSYLLWRRSHNHL